MSKHMAPYPPEFRAEAIRLARTSGKPHAEIARELGMTGETLRRWLKQADLDEGKRSDGLTSDEQEELRRLRRENRRVTRGARNSKKSRGLLRPGEQRDPVVVYEFVEREKAHHAVVRLCHTLGVSPSGYWAWRKRGCSARSQVDAPPAAEMRLIARGYEADTQQHINNCVYLDWFDEAAERAAAAGALTGASERLRPRFYRLEYIQQTQPGDALRVLTATPQRAASRGLGFWQTLTTAADGPGAGAVLARVWTECLRTGR